MVHMALFALCWMIIAIEKKGRMGMLMLAFYACLFLLFFIDSKIVSKQVNQYVQEIIGGYSCAPKVEALQKRDESWSGDSNSYLIVKELRGLLAVRTIVYQETGLLRYGFFDDADRTYKFSLCEKTIQ